METMGTGILSPRTPQQADGADGTVCPAASGLAEGREAVRTVSDQYLALLPPLCCCGGDRPHRQERLDRPALRMGNALPGDAQHHVLSGKADRAAAPLRHLPAT